MAEWISEDVISVAASYDLIALSAVKAELSIPDTDTGNDTWLAIVITQCSVLCASYCNRGLVPERVTETQQIQQDPYPYQTPGGVRPLQLARWPALKVYSVEQVYPIAFDNTMTVNQDYSIDFRKGMLQRLNPFTGVACIWESVPTIIDYIAGYGAWQTANYTIPTTPFQITPTNATALSCDLAVVNTSTGTAFTQVTGTPASGQYAFNAVTGVFTFAAADLGIQVTISFAYRNVPADIQYAATRMVTQRFFQRSRDPLLMQIDQPNLGTKRYWIPTGGGQSGAVPPDIAGILAPYRVPVVV